MEELEEAVLTIRSRLSKVNNRGLIGDDFTLRINSLPVTLHIQLLKMRGKFAKSLAVGNDGS